MLGQGPAGKCPHHRLPFVFSLPAVGGARLQHLCDRERPARLPVPGGGEQRLLGDRHHDHRRLLRRVSPDGTGAAVGLSGDALGFRHHCHSHRDPDGVRGAPSPAAVG